MKILMLVNWKIEYCEKKPKDKQPPDYYVKGEPYWFYRYFNEQPVVDVVDISSVPWVERFEKDKIRFYIWQTLKILPKLKQYDLIVSHGMQSGAVLCLWRRLFKIKAKHVVFDIGSFNSAAEKGFAFKLMRFVSKSIDGLIYHTSSQIEYYKKHFPWLVDKAVFLRYGVDFDFFGLTSGESVDDKEKYIVCIGKNKSDWETVIHAYREQNIDVKLRLIGGYDERYAQIKGVEQLPYMSIRDLIEQIQGAIYCVLPIEYVRYSLGQMRLLQQMALGKCVVVSKIPSLMDYGTDRENVLFYEAGNVKECSEVMKEALSNEKLREQIGENARVFACDKCNEKIMAEAIEKAYAHFMK